MEKILPTSNTLVKIETWADLLESVNNLHGYLDTLVEKKQKLRLALDMETYIAYESRYEYNLRHSLKACRKKEAKQWALSILAVLNQGAIKASKIDLSEAPEGFEFKLDAELPIPYPVKNKKGLYDARVRLIQIGLDPKNVDLQYNFDLDKIVKEHFDICLDTLEDNNKLLEIYKAIGEVFKPLLERTCIVGQYLPYEYSFLWHFFKAVPKEMRDVGLMSQIYWMGDMINHKLSNLYRLIDKDTFAALIDYKPQKIIKQDMAGNTTEEYINDPHGYYDKFKEEEQKSPWYLPELDDNQHIYAAEDVRLIWPVFHKLCEQLVDWADLYGQGILEVVTMEMELIRAIAKSKVVGFSLDVPYCKEVVIPHYRGLMDEAQAEIDKMYSRTVVTKKKRTIGRGKDKTIEHYEVVTQEQYNLGSWQQIRALTGLGKNVMETTGYKDLIFFKDKHPAVKWLIQYKKAQKALGFFESDTSGYLTLVDSDNKIHHTTHQIGKDDTDEGSVSSGRMAGSKPNLMQVDGSEMIRKAFVAPQNEEEEWVLVVKDFTQIEPTILAEISQDEFLCNCFREKRDLHAETAKTVFKLDELPLSHGPTAHWRKKGKVVRLARTFMMGVVKGMKDVYVKSDGELDYILRGKEGEEEFAEILQNFDNLTPGVQRLQNEIAAEVRELPYRYGGMYEFRTGRPFYVHKSMMGRTRRFTLEPQVRTWVTQDPDRYKTDVRELYEKTGKISTWANKANFIIRDAAKNAFNNTSQSSGADIFKLSIVNINKRFEEQVQLGVMSEKEVMINFVHDEIITQCRRKNAKLVEQIMEEEMLKAARRFIVTVPVRVEGGIAREWCNAK